MITSSTTWIRFIKGFQKLNSSPSILGISLLTRSIYIAPKQIVSSKLSRFNRCVFFGTLSPGAQLTKMTETEFGSWKSPISSQLATESSVSFIEINVDKTDKKGPCVYWTELRCDEAGRYVVCSADQPGSSVTDWTPKEHSARTLVHEYGGGACFVHNGNVYFSNFTNQRMYVQKGLEGSAESLTPDGKGWRFADGSLSDKTGKIYAVREDHGVIERKERKEAENTIVAIDPTTQLQTVLVSGADFYSSPRVSPDGKQIAWIQWVHPNMPWDTTELWTAQLNSTGDQIVADSAKMVAGGNDTSVIEPKWTTDGDLLYLGDQTDWWNLYHVTPSGEHVNLRQVDTEIGGPHWTFGFYYYDIDPSGSGLIATAYDAKLGILNMKDKSYREISTGYTNHSNIQYGCDGKIYCVAIGPTSFSVVIQVDPNTDKVQIVQKSRNLMLDEGYLSVPESISWPTKDGEASHGYFYPPKNKDCKAPAGSLPPLLVKAHGGPTGHTSDGLNLGIQYFTSRGFGVLDVNYRGSTGFGKPYRHRLRKSWGILDVDDCCSGALYLSESKQADKERLCIDGGSAGGYTTLACLAFEDVFKAGASRYGIGDLEVLIQDTHKFESRYCDNLIGPYTEEYLPQIHARSPIKHLEDFNCPVVFFQGDEDKIVPPNQSKMMFDAVKAKGLPCAYVLFEGEQHGFRKTENIQKALDGEFYFYGKVFGFTPADQVGEIPIANM